RADRLHWADPGLGRPVGLPRQRGPGGGDGVDRIRLALGPPGLAIWPVDLNDRDPLSGEVTSQPRTVGAGALDTDLHDRAVRAQPRQQRSVAGCGGRELPLTKHTAGLVDHGGVVGLAVSIDATRDLLLLRCHAGLVVPFACTEQG